MAYELPPLPYDYNALEPFIDAETMHLHHDKHHQAYINNVNAALASHPALAAKTVDDLIADLNAVPEEIRGAVRNNGGGHSNHTMFWNIMGPANTAGIGGSPSGEIAKQISADFGDFEAFKKTFNETTAKQFGSGWGWLVFTGGKLKILTTPIRIRRSRRDSIPSWATTCGSTPITSSTRTAAPNTWPRGGTWSTGPR